MVVVSASYRVESVIGRPAIVLGRPEYMDHLGRRPLVVAFIDRLPRVHDESDVMVRPLGYGRAVLITDDTTEIVADACTIWVA
jgi:hypothetical protein